MKANRSDKYQFQFRELSTTSEYLSNFENGQSISSALAPFKYNEEILDLEEEVRKEFWVVAEKVLTFNQFRVIRMWADGGTQTEIAAALSVNQSSIAKTLQGNRTYIKGQPKSSKTYGGAIPKLRNAMAKDIKIQELLAKINELQEEKL